jgi:hypothetical protein
MEPVMAGVHVARSAAGAGGAMEGRFSMELTSRGCGPSGEGLNVINKRPLDLVQLSRRSRRDPGVEREALAHFREQSAVCLDRLGGASGAGDWLDAVHALDDSARSVGAWELSQTARAAGRLRGAPHCSACAALLKTLEAQVSDANAFIAEILKHA